MKDSTLVSKEWCDLVFEGRNKEYGAYELRRTTGRRYRYVGMILGGIFAFLLLLAGILGFFVYRAIKQTVQEVEEVVKMKPLKDPEIRRVSTGRRAVAKASPNAARETPTVTDEQVVSVPIGIKGPEDAEKVVESSIVDQDAFHNMDQKDLPVEGPQLMATEVVEEMPVFPGGLTALMQFMDENTVYSQSAIKQKLEGDVEVAFIIDKEGNVIEPQIIKSLNPTLDRAVLLAVKKMPKWKPGTTHGRPTFTRISIPFHFDLFEPKKKK